MATPVLSSNVPEKRSILGARARWKDADDPSVTQARLDLAEEKFVAAVERALASAPPMRPEVRDRVVALLSTTGDPSSA